MKDKYPEGSDVNVRLKNMLEVFERDNAALMCPVPDAGYTIIHSDNHVNNLLFQYDKASIGPHCRRRGPWPANREPLLHVPQDTGKVQQCRLIDFQMVVYGNPAIDVLLVLYVCADKALRRGHWDSLLRAYHGEVQAVVSASGCEDPDAVYSWQVLQVNENK